MDSVRLVTGIEKKMISEPCLTLWVWLNCISLNKLVNDKQYDLSSLLLTSSKFD